MDSFALTKPHRVRSERRKAALLLYNTAVAIFIPPPAPRSHADSWGLGSSA